MVIKKLHELLHSINKSELRYLSRTVNNSFKPDSNAYKIYQLLKQKNFDRKNIAEFDNKGVYLGRLKDFILEQLVIYDTKSVEGKILKYINEARVLLERKQYNWAYDLLEKAFDLVEKYELIDYKLMIHSVILKTTAYGILASAKFSVENIITNLNQITIDFEEYIIHRNIASEHMQMGNGKHHLTEQELKNYQTSSRFKGMKIWSLSPLELPEVADGSPFATRLLSMQNKGYAHRYLSDYDNWLKSIDAQIALLNTKPHMIDYRPTAMKTLLHERMRIFMFQERYNEMLEAITDLENYMNGQPSLPSKLYYMQYTIMYKIEALNQLIKKGDIQYKSLFDRFLTEALNYYKKYHNEYDSQGKYLTIFNLSLIAFSAEKLALSNQCLNEYFTTHSKRSKNRPYLYYLASMLEIAIQISYLIKDFNSFTKQSKDRIKSMIHTYKKRCEHNDRHYKIEYNVLNCCLAILESKDIQSSKVLILEHLKKMEILFEENKQEKSYEAVYIKWSAWYKRLI